MPDTRQSEEPAAPWVEFPHSTPSWGGWRQASGEQWLLTVWLPFWHGLTDAEQADYLTRYPVPDDDWQLQLDVFWRRT